MQRLWRMLQEDKIRVCANMHVSDNAVTEHSKNFCREKPDGRSHVRPGGPVLTTHCVRLPEIEAQDAIQFLMQHSDTSIWHVNEMV